jgi:integrase
MILVGFWAALRVSELVAVQVEHLQPHPDGTGTLYLYDSKTHGGDETMKRELPRRAMLAVDTWLHASGIHDGPVFRGFDPRRKPRATSMTTTSANTIIKAAAAEMGVNSDLLRHQRPASSHGLRIGFVQEALSKDISSDKIVLAGGWKSSAMVTLYGRDLPRKDTGSAVLAKMVGE